MRRGRELDRHDAKGLPRAHAVACASNALTASQPFPVLYDARGFLEEMHLPCELPDSGGQGTLVWPGSLAIEHKLAEFRALFDSACSVSSLCGDAVEAISWKAEQDGLGSQMRRTPSGSVGAVGHPTCDAWHPPSTNTGSQDTGAATPQPLAPSVGMECKDVGAWGSVAHADADAVPTCSDLDAGIALGGEANDAGACASRRGMEHRDGRKFEITLE